MKQYIFNKETLKIELKFDKTEYQAMSEEQKAQLKSAFLFSGRNGCWVSRAKEPALWIAKAIAKELGFEKGEDVGERLTFAEQVERRQERAEARAERYEQYAEMHKDEGEQKQSAFKNAAGDWSFVTQPNMNTSAGRAFTNYRQKLLDRYEKGFEEYRKSEYFANRAATARETASNDKFKNNIYLFNRIQECRKAIRQLTKNIIACEEKIFKIEQGEEVKRCGGEVEKIEDIKERLTNYIERCESEMDKQAYMQNCIDQNNQGKTTFTEKDFQKGDSVKLASGEIVKVTGVGPLNITYTSRFNTFGLKYPIVSVVEIVKKAVCDE